MANKTCSKCSGNKPEDEFHFRDKQRGIRRGVCRGCISKYNGQWYLGVREKRIANVQRWKRKNPGHALKYKYGITQERFTQIKAAQDGKCAICGAIDGGGRGLSVDHCHSSGEVRGLLCGNCNSALGLLKDDVSLLLSAVQYLSRNARKAG